MIFSNLDRGAGFDIGAGLRGLAMSFHYTVIYGSPATAVLQLRDIVLAGIRGMEKYAPCASAVLRAN
jgi:hypothetical protein